MSDNSSSSDFDCMTSSIGLSKKFSILILKMIIILVLSILVLHEGYQQWQQGSRTSHSDVFTYNVIVIELIFVLGTVVSLCGAHTNQSMVSVGMFMIAFVCPGETLFNIVTCVERHLAVVHPVTYLGLRHSGGLRVRNICIVCVWLLCFGWLGVAALYYPAVPYVPYFCVTAASVLIVSFCSLSVLCALIRPGPGVAGADGEKIDRSKRKAFYTITAIMVVLLMSFAGMLVAAGFSNSHLLSNSERCAMFFNVTWFTLPISLVLPLLFLHRAGKLSCSFFNKTCIF